MILLIFITISHILSSYTADDEEILTESVKISEQ